MPEPDSTALGLARWTEDRADEEERKFAILMAWLFAQLERITPEQIQLVGQEFIGRLDSLISGSASETRLLAADKFTSSFNINQQVIPGQVSPQSLPLLDRTLLNEEASIRQRGRQMVENMVRRARQHAALTNADGALDYRNIAISKSEAYNLQKALDASILNSIGHEFWLQGLGRFGKKIVVAVLDKDTTRLCRGLHGSVWAWEEPIVDKRTGGSRMFPPFIGSTFQPRFHKCRSTISPYVI